MHELSVIEGVLQIANTAARDHAAVRVCVVRMKIGSLSGVVEDSLRFAFEVLRVDTESADADLVIETVRARCSCPACGVDFEPDTVVYACPECGALSHKLLAGREIEVSSVELELDEVEVSLEHEPGENSAECGAG